MGSTVAGGAPEQERAGNTSGSSGRRGVTLLAVPALAIWGAIPGAAQPLFTSGDPADVEVVALTGEPLAQPQAFADCCLFCQPQRLEALRLPAAGRPWARLEGGEPVGRVTYCGEVVSYAVNDECDDPRDILVNIRPGPGFEAFVEGFGRTACSPEEPCIHAEITPAEQFFEEDEMFLPISGDGRCDGGSCLFGGGEGCSSQLEREGTSLCVHGVYAFDHGQHQARPHGDLAVVLDPKHDHPEVHPFDAIWWPDAGGDGWVFAVLQDDSNRYSHPYCGDNNASGWSQAPRDLRLRFPFSFPRSEAPVRVDLRRFRTRDFSGRMHAVRPLNVTTALFTRSREEPGRRRLAVAGEVLLEVVEEEGMDPEVEVGLEASVEADRIRGFVGLRVAVGCDPRVPAPSCSGSSLRAASPRGRHDPSDPGSGFFYGELAFRSAARPSLTARLRLAPADDGRFDLRIDGAVVAPRVGDGGSTGPMSVAVGAHRVSATAAAGTDGRDYSFSFAEGCSPDGRVDLSLGEELTCTVVARRLPDPGETERCLAGCARTLEACKVDPATLPEVCVQANRACEALCGG